MFKYPQNEIYIKNLKQYTNKIENIGFERTLSKLHYQFTNLAHGSLWKILWKLFECFANNLNIKKKGEDRSKGWAISSIQSSEMSVRTSCHN